MTTPDPEAQTRLRQGEGGERFHLELRHPEQLAKLPPCQGSCPGNGEIRKWIGLVAQRGKLGLTPEEAYTRAWRILAARNPFPASIGRVCPHPCEAGCNREGKDGAVRISALERFLGDWALDRRLPLPRESEESHPEFIGVIGSGPAGLSFAYQMARRGYAVTVYERHARPGGMLTFGIPEYRLPESVVSAEIQRILDLGVRLELGTAVGKNVTIEELHARHAILFLGIGAQKGTLMAVPGEDGPGVWAGTTYLELVNDGQPVELGGRVVVVGGGNTAVDAARAARRGGAEVTLLYRRTRREMPAIESEVEDALQENVRVEFLAAPVAILRAGAVVRAVEVQKMRLGEPDESGRRRPVPIAGAVYEVPADAVIAAISQEPDWDGLGGIESFGESAPAPGSAWLGDDVLVGGDVLGAGIASRAVGQGRLAAEAAHARLRGLAAGARKEGPPIPSARIRADYYPPAPAASPRRRPVAEWLTRPDQEIAGSLGEREFLGEVGRCLSCGSCFGCQHCVMYCNTGGYSRLTEPRPGAYFALALDRCEGCGKCIEVCPCGFLSLADDCSSRPGEGL